MDGCDMRECVGAFGDPDALATPYHFRSLPSALSCPVRRAPTCWGLVTGLWGPGNALGGL